MSSKNVTDATQCAKERKVDYETIEIINWVFVAATVIIIMLFGVGLRSVSVEYRLASISVYAKIGNFFWSSCYFLFFVKYATRKEKLLSLYFLLMSSIFIFTLMRNTFCSMLGQHVLTATIDLVLFLLALFFLRRIRPPGRVTS